MAEFPSVEWFDALAAKANAKTEELAEFGFAYIRLACRINGLPGGDKSFGIRIEGYDVASDGEVEPGSWGADCVLEGCLECGACEIPCDPGAISQGTDFQIAYVIDPLLCNDCGECIPVCPVEALVEDSEWAVCLARGCPLTASRLAGWECTQGRGDQGGVCPQCHAFLWKPEGEDAWRCPRCDDHMRVICPKVRKAEAVIA